jgi:hypothetical protein
MQPTVEAHTRGLDAAHNKLREHDATLTGLATQTTHYLERLVRVEAATSEQHRLLVQLGGGVESLRVEQSGILRAIETVAETGQSTHDLLVTHIDQNTAAAEAAHLTRLNQVERLSVRLIKIATAITVLTGLVAMLYSLLTKQPILSLFIGGLK